MLNITESIAFLIVRVLILTEMRYISDLTISEPSGFCCFYDPSFINVDC